MVDQLQDILSVLGEFGPYQRYQYFLHWLSWVTAGVTMMSYLFIFPMLEHRCFVEEIDETPGFIDWALWNQHLVNDSCSMIDGETQESIPCPNGYVYSSAHFQSSRIMDWDMVCDREWMRALLQSIFLFGALVGAFLSGSLADKYGRKPVFCVSGAGQLVFGLTGCCLTNYVAFALSMFLYGMFGAAGAMVSAMAMSMEIVGDKGRTLCGVLFIVAFTTGSILVPTWAWLLPKNAELLEIIYALHSLLLLGHWWLLDESICWLWANGKREEALKIAKKAAKQNGKTFQVIELSSIEFDDVSASNSEQSYGMMDLFKHRELRRRVFIMTFAWFSTSIVYFGLTYNSVNLFGNPHLIFIINVLVEVPGNFVVILIARKTKNKPMFYIPLLLSGMACIVLSGLPANAVTTAMNMIAKLLVSMSFNILNCYTAELFPTVIRNSALGLCLMGARAGATLIPQINLLGKEVKQAPSISFGLCGMLASLLVMFMMPETMGKPIPQSIDDVEKRIDDNNGCDG